MKMMTRDEIPADWPDRDKAGTELVLFLNEIRDRYPSLKLGDGVAILGRAAGLLVAQSAAPDLAPSYLIHLLAAFRGGADDIKAMNDETRH